MMEHAEHSPAAIREKAAGAVNCQSVTKRWPRRNTARC